MLQLTTVRDRPIVAGGLRVTPESQVLTLRLPFGGAVWHRPTAVIVEHVGQAGVAVRRLPIVDVTRAAQLAVVLATLLVTVVCLIVASRHEES